MAITKAAKPDFISPWQEACAKVIKDNTSDQAELYQKLLDMKA